MKAIVFDKELKLDKNYPKPVPQEGEALIRVTLAGICNTDYEITKGYMGYVDGEYLLFASETDYREWLES